MPGKEKWRWQFFGFESQEEGRPVKEWIDLLEDDHRYEVFDLLIWLSNEIRRPWKLPQFDPLAGAGGISEIRIPDIRTDAGVVCYRIYGDFGPRAEAYTLLHGTQKGVKNDRDGKRIAKGRLDRLKGGYATVHRIDLEEVSNPPPDEGAEGEGEIC